MKHRIAALCLVVMLFLPHTQALAASSAPKVYSVTSFDELAYYVLQSMNDGKTELYFSGFSPFIHLASQDNRTVLFALVNAGTWKNINNIEYGSTTFGKTIYRLGWTIWEDQYNNVESATVKAAQEIVDAALTADMTDREKYKELHDWLSRRVTYDLSAQYNGQSAWTALVDRRSVCNGYTKAYMLLCELAGLPSLFITGTAGGESHSWNMVPMDGQWLYIDTTWDDAYSADYGYVSDRYFMLDYKTLVAGEHRLLFDYTRMATMLLPHREDMADALSGYGLFAGSDKGYELARTPNRAEVAVMLVRMMGLTGEYTNEREYPIPFTDVPSWAVSYVAVLYHRGITLGVGGGRYGSADDANLTMFCNFLYRALGYEAGDYQYNQALSLIQARGLLLETERQAIEFRGFTRGDLVMLCYRALDTTLKDSTVTLYEHLSGMGAIRAAP